MESAELLSEFQSKVDQFVKFQGFVEKAQAQAEKFSQAVIGRVIEDNTRKRDDILSEVIPMMVELDSEVARLEQEKQAILDAQRDQRLLVEEMELRKAIGELTEEEFDQQSHDLRELLSSSDKSIEALDEQAAGYANALSLWREVAGEAGVLAMDAEEVQPEVIESGSGEGADGIRFEEVHAVDDVSVVFEDAAEEPVSLEVGAVDVVVADQEPTGATAEAEMNSDRRAVLLYQEGTAEEQVHPFTGEVVTLGRGRDNDIQVKNDSKVSRYHCKLYRRGDNFYIEDNKSANGSLVNGELITERRLFGGEEIIIGETFFRFRIMD